MTYKGKKGKKRKKEMSLPRKKNQEKRKPEKIRKIFRNLLQKINPPFTK
jgi:hypothetical protein